MQDLYQRYGRALRRKCARILGNSQDAEDVVQMIFVELFARRVRESDVSLAYLYRAATTRCLNRLRDRRRRRDLLDQHGQDTVLMRSEAGERVVSMDLLTRLVDRLDGPLADVFVYLFLDHLTQAEVADLMGTSRKTVGHRLGQIRHVLTELMEAP